MFSIYNRFNDSELRAIPKCGRCFQDPHGQRFSGLFGQNFFLSLHTAFWYPQEDGKRFFWNEMTEAKALQ